MRGTIRLLSCCLLAASAQAGPRNITGTHFSLKQIVINGNTNVDAVALNNAGAIVGAYVDGQNNLYGFIRQDKQVTVLPPVTTDCPFPDGCVAIPAAVNDAGDVIAEFDNGFATSVIWKNAGYDSDSYVQLSFSGDTFGLLAFNESDEEAFNYYEGPGGWFPEAGIPPNVQGVKLPGDSPFITGLNNKGLLVGTAGLLVRGSEIKAAFAGRNGRYKTIAPPGASAVFNPVINDQGDVAGSYADAAGAYHGFVYATRNYTIFDAPSKTTAFSVYGINRSGRVIGVYKDAASGEQRLFWFNGATVTAFGRFSGDDYVYPALNDRGVGIVEDGTGVAATSYIIRCAGAGC